MSEREVTEMISRTINRDEALGKSINWPKIYIHFKFQPDNAINELKSLIQSRPDQKSSHWCMQKNSIAYNFSIKRSHHGSNRIKFLSVALLFH